EMPLSVGRETFVDEQATAAVLEVIALVLEIGDAFIRWADVLDFVANVLCVGPSERVLCSHRIDLASDQNGNLPFIFRFGNTRTGNFGAENDPPLGARLAAATALLVARAGWKEDDRVCRVDKHRRVHDDVLMNAQLDFAQSAIDQLR